MIWIPITYLVVTTLTPGPVTMMTVYQSIRYGRPAGTAVALGGAATTVIFVAASLILALTERAGLPLHTATFYRQSGALLILLLGFLSAYKLLSADSGAASAPCESGHWGRSFLTGMGLMTPYFPQALLFYTVILPSHQLGIGLVGNILLLGAFKIGLTLSWYMLLAQGAGSIQTWFYNRLVRRVIDLTAVSFLMGIGIMLLFF